VDGLASQHLGGHAQVAVAAVLAGADAHLVHRCPRHRGDRHHRIRAGGLRHQRLQPAHVQLDDLPVGDVRVRRQRDPVALAALRAEEAVGLGVAGEDGGGGPQLGDHVGDGRALVDVQVLQTLAAEFKNLPHAALDREAAQQFQDHVLPRDPRSQASGQPHVYHLRHDQPVGLAGHGQSHVQATRTDGQHPQRPGHGGVAVRPQEHAPRDGEPLQVHLVADPVPRPAVEQPVSRGEGAEEAVVVGVLEADLQHVVVHVHNRGPGADPLHAHGLKLQGGHGPGGILQQRLVHVQGDLRPRRGLPLHQVRLDDLLADRSAHGLTSVVRRLSCGGAGKDAGIARAHRPRVPATSRRTGMRSRVIRRFCNEASAPRAWAARM